MVWDPNDQLGQELGPWDPTKKPTDAQNALGPLQAPAGPTQTPGVVPAQPPMNITPMAPNLQPMTPPQVQPQTNITPPAPPPAPFTGNGATTFGDSSNLIGSQINPSVNPVGGPAADVSKLRGQLGDLTGNIGAQAPDRKALALDALKTFDENQANTEKLGIRNIGRNAAAAGRLGSGMVSTELGDLQSVLNQQREQTLRGLSGDVAGQTLNDRLDAITGTRGALGDLSDMDLGTQDQQFRQGTTNDEALRRERSYQYGLDQDAIDRDLEQKRTEDDLLNSSFDRDYRKTALAGSQAFNGSPTALALAQLFGGQSGDTEDAIAQFLQTYAAGGR